MVTVGPITVGSRWQLFIDDRFVTHAHNVGWALEHPDVCDESLLEPLKTWERGHAGAWRSMLFHNDRFHY